MFYSYEDKKFQNVQTNHIYSEPNVNRTLVNNLCLRKTNTYRFFISRSITTIIFTIHFRID